MTLLLQPASAGAAAEAAQTRWQRRSGASDSQRKRFSSIVFLTRRCLARDTIDLAKPLLFPSAHMLHIVLPQSGYWTPSSLKNMGLSSFRDAHR